jgi:hypothetical protein
MRFDFNEEKEALQRSIKKMRVTPISKETLLKELVINGVSWAVSVSISMLLRQFVVVKSVKNLWGVFNRDKVLLDKTEFEVLSWILAFIIGLFVFTVVERFMEIYLDERKEK